MANHLFISYKHKAASAKVALRFFDYLKAVSGGLNFSVFMDTDIESAQLWSDEIQTQLEETTHFICLLTTSYWTAPQCRRELFFALEQFKQTAAPKLLFVLVEKLNPAWFVFDKETGVGELKSDDPKIKSVGDINFLGPYNKQRQLIRLQHEDDAVLQDQFFQLTERIQKVLK